MSLATQSGNFWILPRTYGILENGKGGKEELRWDLRETGLED